VNRVTTDEAPICATLAIVVAARIVTAIAAAAEALRASVDIGGPTVNGTKAKRSRRSWSAEEKRQIVDEAMVPGASVAEIARRHGVNANLVFTWCKAARSAPSVSTAELTASATRLVGDASPAATEVCAFVSVGVIGRAEDGEPALAIGASSAVVSGISARTCMGFSLSRGFHRSRFLLRVEFNRGRSRGAVRLRRARRDRVR
jgi:hypothetical protein